MTIPPSLKERSNKNGKQILHPDEKKFLVVEIFIHLTRPHGARLGFVFGSIHVDAR